MDSNPTNGDPRIQKPYCLFRFNQRLYPQFHFVNVKVVLANSSENLKEVEINASDEEPNISPNNNEKQNVESNEKENPQLKNPTPYQEISEMTTNAVLESEAAEAKAEKKKRKIYEWHSYQFEKLEIRKSVFIQALKKLFLGDSIEDFRSAELNNLEQRLISLIIEKKLRGSKEKSNISTSVSSLSKISLKRSEENLKFGFRRIIKRMCRSLSFSSQKELFRHYFSKKADFKSEPIERYMTPKSSNHPANFRTFSQTYAGLLQKSSQFIEDFERHTDLFFDSDELKQLISKHIDQFLKNLTLKFSNIDDFLVVENYISNVKCKLPWTMAEAKKAAISLKNYLHN